MHDHTTTHHGPAFTPEQIHAARAKPEWPEGWYPGDAPRQIDLSENADASPHPCAKFDTAQRVRFLDALAGHGNVRKAAARVGVSRETAYRARRRHADFAQLWNAALVHARAAGEAELADRAMEGVPVPVFVRGEHVATWNRRDARLLLAHLARLDRRIEEDRAAVARAERFDQLLATMAGHAAPDDFTDAVISAHGFGVQSQYGDTLPTRADYVAYARDHAISEEWEQDHGLDEDGPADNDLVDGEPAEMDESDSDGDSEDWKNPELTEAEQAEEDAMDAVGKQAGEAWDRWNAGGAVVLDRVLECRGLDDNREPDEEAQDSDTCVNTPGGRVRKMRFDTMCSAAALGSGGV